MIQLPSITAQAVARKSTLSFGCVALQSDAFSEVLLWLKQIQFDYLAGVLHDDLGIESMSDLRFLNDKDLEDCGVKQRIKRRKFLAHVAKLGEPTSCGNPPDLVCVRAVIVWAVIPSRPCLACFPLQICSASVAKNFTR